MIKNKRGAFWIWLLIILIILGVGVALLLWYQNTNFIDAAAGGGSSLPQPPTFP